MKPTTAILRFRDLVTSENGTIEEHKRVIDEHGYVWWAWWKKSYERTPDDLSILSTMVKDNPTHVFLVDSGQYILYRAVCNEIEVRMEHEILSPERDKTPEYYCDQSYFAWFRFTELEQCDESELKNYSYVNCNQIFDNTDTDYSRFESKRVYSMSELVQQNRTIWFVRDASPDDPDNEIVLLNAEFTEPQHFSKKYYQSSGDTLLWLSDLHLADNVFANSAGRIRPTLAKQICQCINNKRIAGLLISGDITSRAEKQGFHNAQQLLKDISSELEYPLNPENIILCPGNHDFQRLKIDLKEKREPDWIYDRDNSTKEFANFYQSIFKIRPNKYFASGKKILLSSGHIVDIVSLNSLMLQQYSNFDGHGYISQKQLDYVTKQMGWDNSINQMSIRVVMMHHHLLPTCHVEAIDVRRASSVVYDAERLMEWMAKYHVNLFLHGHKHNSFFAEVAYPRRVHESVINYADFQKISVVGMGGTGASGVDNLIATIQFAEKTVSIKFYRLHSDQISADGIYQTIKFSI